MMLLNFLLLAYLTQETFTQKLVSPCPSIFRYEPKSDEENTWYGVLTLKTDEDLVGIWITIRLDSRAELLGNWFGDTYSVDNKDFRIANAGYTLEAGPPVTVRFFVRYKSGRIPRLTTIRLNGMTICSENNTAKTTTPKLHISMKGTVPDVDEGLISHDNDDVTTPRSPGRGTGNVDGTFNSHRGNTDSDGTFGTGGRGTGNVDGTFNSHRGNTDSDRTFGTGGRGTGNVDGTFNSHRGNTDSDRTSGTTGSSNTHGRPLHTTSGSDDSLTGGDNNGVYTRPNQNTDRHKTNNDSEEDFFPGDFNIRNPANPSGSRQKDSTKSITCGTVSSRPRPLITHGQDTVPGEWPWHTAIYHAKGLQLVYICGGTLISDKFVLTAAHCVARARSNRKVDTESILVYFGKYNLKTFGSEVQDRELAEIHLHPDYNHSFYYNDIAILELARPVQITDFVRPCCLWDEEINLEYIINKQGTVVGWGFDERNKISEKLLQAKMPVVSTIQCIYSNRDFFSQFTFDKNYCAGFRNGTSVCNGDSGGSMVFPRRGTNGQSTVWHIRGIVSVGVALQSEGVCDTSNYVIFTDVAKYLTWINSIVKN